MTKPLLPITIIGGLCIFIISCGKHVYMMSAKEINGYAVNARESRPKAFVVYNNGDTLKGTVLKKRKNIVSGKDTWALDGKDIPLENIHSYQDEYGYRLGNYSRMLKGKLSLYVHQVDNTRLVTNYSESSKTYQSKMTGSTETTFYMGLHENIQVITYNSLTQMMKDCPPAIKQIDTELGGGMFKKKPAAPVNDYRALIRIFNIYNNCK